MAEFQYKFQNFDLDDGRHGSSGAGFSGSDFFSGLSSEDLLSILRPAAETLAEHYKATIERLFKRRTGSLADSFRTTEFGADREYLDKNEASMTVGPTGRHKKSRRMARSRAGNPSARYAKHNREAKETTITNAELGYLFEVGTPRIDATHWMENANEEIEEKLQDIMEEEFDKVLKSKGLI